ncbi:OmpA family protein [Thalassobaculum sp. OXR-137]|uniref:OmpA family protein n=1 Tax=Thalassobaculum sp. OXR-137 TaxID=3100173 RepID=UPI002AC8C21B|nr:OmpA family protein [Thalassobaculum sp. OXR-137]WPZ32801.1 OmpA family protein [Thalassobaculum sp. OXR-137]
MVETTKKIGSGFVGTRGATRRRLPASPLIGLAAALALSGCSSVPDALNPVEWYEGTTDTVGGWLSDDEPQASAPADASSADKPFPNLASVPQRPTPTTTAEERAAIQQGLVADRDSARYTDSTDVSAPAAPPTSRSGSGQQTASLPASPPPSPTVRAPDTAPAPNQAAVMKSTPPPAAPTVATPAPVPAPAAPATRAPEPAPAPASGENSGLWPRRPAPDSKSVTPATSGRVSDIQSTVVENQSAPTRALAAEPRMAATASGAGTRAEATGTPAPAATGRSLDSAGNQPTARVTPPPSAKSEDGPEITRTLIETRTVHRTADGDIAHETVRRPGEAPAPVASAPSAATTSAAAPSATAPTAPSPVPSAPSYQQQASAPPSAPMPTADSAVDQSPSVIVDGPALDQYQMGFTGPAYLVGTVNFAHGSAALNADDLDMVRSIASAAQETDAFIRVIGHASSRTAEMALASHELVNFQESMDRAQTVADALIAAGVPRERVLVEAMSASQPLYYESMPSGEAGNRRAEILFQY